MKEETNKRSGELNDAALESVSGGVVVSKTDVLKLCETCPSRTDFPRYSCTYEDGDLEKLKAKLHRSMLDRGLSEITYGLCPYLKRTY